MSRKRRTAADEPSLVVRSSASNVHGGAVIEAHAHEWHQLLYSSAGLMRVWTEQGSWIAPPSRGVWVPAGVRHSLRFVGESSFRTIYLRPDWALGGPASCTSVSVSALLRELILRTVEVGMLDRRDELELAMATVLRSEVRGAGAAALTLPMPASAALRRAAGLMSSQTLPQVARAIGLGTRTFERRFLAETGLSPGRWRQQQALLAALEALAGGAQVKEVAASAGYLGPSAFVAAFRKTFGVTPARYFAAGP